MQSLLRSLRAIALTLGYALFGASLVAFLASSSCHASDCDDDDDFFDDDDDDDCFHDDDDDTVVVIFTDTDDPSVPPKGDGVPRIAPDVPTSLLGDPAIAGDGVAAPDGGVAVEDGIGAGPFGATEVRAFTDLLLASGAAFRPEVPDGFELSFVEVRFEREHIAVDYALVATDATSDSALVAEGPEVALRFVFDLLGELVWIEGPLVGSAVTEGRDEGLGAELGSSSTPTSSTLGR